MATETKSSSKYDNTPKRLIRSGSPDVYELLPKKEDIGTLKKLTLGKRDPKKTNRTILLVGETGTGKSTLINALVNYAMGVEWEDNIMFQIIEEEKNTAQGGPQKESQSVSQTSDVIVYEIFGFEGKTLPYSLTIIDTPGYGDTRGAEQDDKISQRMLDVFRSKDGVHEMNVICLVLKSTENRLSDRLMYIFDSVVSLFGKDMENNIISLITHSDMMTPTNVLQALEAAHIKCAKDEDNEPVHFLFNNHQSKQRTKENKLVLKCAWDFTNSQMEEFTEFLLKRDAQSLVKTVEVLNERIRLTACIQNLQDRVQLIELKQRETQQIQEALKKQEEQMKSNEEDFDTAKKKHQTEIQQTKEALKKHEEEMKKHEEQMKRNQNINVWVDEPYKVKESIKGGTWGLGLFYEGAVCCNVCQETICRLKHLEKVKTTQGDVEEKYERSKADCEETFGLLVNTEKRMEELQKDKDQCLDTAFQHVEKLEQIALNADSLSTLVHLDYLIQKMKERGDTEKGRSEVT
ncbi:septin-1-like [Notolabrus celidotus]|uniref:septin-1-like n=1 Tax=Notolabrus celidotus TaxID=1203425 RepID=UPI00148F4F50|nr:septin-1-like [Notolabrus celidotus]